MITGLEPCLRLRLEIGLDPLRPAPASPPSAGGLLRRRRRTIASARLGVDDHTAPATARTARTAALASTAARGTRPATPATRSVAAPVLGRTAARSAIAAGRPRPARTTTLALAFALPRGALALRLRRRSILKDPRATSLGAGSPDRLALWRPDVWTRLRRTALTLRRDPTAPTAT